MVQLDEKSDITLFKNFIQGKSKENYLGSPSSVLDV